MRDFTSVLSYPHDTLTNISEFRVEVGLFIVELFWCYDSSTKPPDWRRPSRAQYTSSRTPMPLYYRCLVRITLVLLKEEYGSGTLT